MQNNKYLALFSLQFPLTCFIIWVEAFNQTNQDAEIVSKFRYENLNKDDESRFLLINLYIFYFLSNFECFGLSSNKNIIQQRPFYKI